MVRGLYTAYTGMANEQKRLDIISNNLANSATVGYKEENVTSKSFKDFMITKIRDGSEAYVDREIGVMNPGVKIGETYMNWDQGSLRETDNTYDMAIQGNGFFAIKVVDKNGDVQVPVDATDVAIKLNGAVYANGEQVDTITLTDFEDYNYLDLYGDNMYNAVDGATTKSSTATILQGFTEQSNVNVVDEMVSMITITRAYEAGQKMIKTQDSLLEQAVSSVGKV